MLPPTVPFSIVTVIAIIWSTNHKNMLKYSRLGDLEIFWKAEDLKVGLEFYNKYISCKQTSISRLLTLCIWIY